MPTLEKCCAKCKLPYPWCGKNRQCKCHAPAEFDDGGPLDGGGLKLVTNDTGRPENVIPLFQEPA